MGHRKERMGESVIDYEFEVLCNNEWLAGSTAQDRDFALKEAQHYVTQYSKDGPCEIWEVTRRKVWPR